MKYNMVGCKSQKIAKGKCEGKKERERKRERDNKLDKYIQ